MKVWSAMWVSAAVAITAAMSVVGCSGEGSGSGMSGQSTTAAPATSTMAAAMTTSSASAPAPVATATTPPHACPKGSTGDGTLQKPCEAKGKDRMMEVTWTGKYGDAGGPSFKVVNKGTEAILYGKVIVYFYDKAGKQIQVKDEAGKEHSSHACSGNLFAGIMKPSEKATINFSCVGKSAIPEGASAIEAEMQLVGFADATEKRSEYYWKNADLTPDARPKGGIK